ncbi:AbrB/MazE/SpoVT family DNA-binding domain-containing protein [bacterium]|nr:AbrB/MazE/SpoVT family DNA-binding domain-containing protein [bacterium]
MKSTGVTVSSRGIIVLPAKLRKEMKIEAGTRILLTREDDKIIMQPVASFTNKLAGLTKKSFGESAEDITQVINSERDDK